MQKRIIFPILTYALQMYNLSFYLYSFFHYSDFLAFYNIFIQKKELNLHPNIIARTRTLEDSLDSSHLEMSELLFILFRKHSGRTLKTTVFE